MTKGLVALVESKTAITDLIGSNPIRFYAKELPQGLSDYPAATFRIVDIDPRNNFDGGSKYDFAFVDIFCYGHRKSDGSQNAYEMASELWDTMRSELEDSSGTFNTIEIDHVWYMASGAEDTIDELDLETKQLELKIAYRR